MLVNIRKWLSPPTFEGEEEKTRAANLLNTVIFIFISGAILYGLFSPVERAAIPLHTTIILPFILILLGLKQVINGGYIRMASLIVVSVLWLLFTTSMFFGSTFNNPAFMGYTVVVVCAGLFLRWRAAIG